MGWRQVIVGWLAAMLLAAVVSAADRIVAVGDLHGDFAAWRAIARDAGVMDAAGRWTGGRTVLVQTGDVPDRGPDSLRIVDELMRLQREAHAAGGEVVTLVGNHEAMNVTDDLRYVTPGEFAAFATPASASLRERVFAANRAKIAAAYRAREPRLSNAAIREKWLAATPLGQIEHQSAWHPTGRIGRWVARNPAVVLIDGTLFVHGGLSAATAKLPLTEINRRVSAALAARDTADDAIINDPAGPLWYRGLAAPASVAARDEELAAVLAAYGAQRLVIGHTPNLRGIVIDAGGRLIRIDTGNSAYYGGTLSWLEIAGGQATAHAVSRPAREATP